MWKVIKQYRGIKKVKVRINTNKNNNTDLKNEIYTRNKYLGTVIFLKTYSLIKRNI